MKFGFKNYYLSWFYSYFMFSFTFDPLAAFFGIAGLVGFVFFVSAAKGTSSINTSGRKDI